MATPFRLKRSAVADRRPTTTDLQLGELALNTHDGFLYAETTGVGSTVSLLTPWREQYGSPTSIYYNHRVGIGSTNPTVSLDVVGDTKLQNNLSVTGITTLGNIVMTTGVISGKLHIPDAGINITDDAAGFYEFQSGGHIQVGTAATNSLQIFHDVTSGHSFISEVGDGDLCLVTNGTNLFLQKDATAGSAEDMIQCIANGEVSLFHNNVKRLATTDTGVNITDNLKVAGISTFINTVNINGVIEANSNLNVDGNLDVDGQTNLDDLAVSGFSTFSDNTHFKDTVRFQDAGGSSKVNFFTFGRLQFNDNVQAAFGNSSQARIGSDGSHLTISNNTGGSYTGTGNIKIQADAGKESIVGIQSGAVELYFDGVKRFETTNSGVGISSNLTVSGISTFNGLIDSTANIQIRNVAPILKFTETDNSKDFFIVGDSNSLSVRMDATGGSNIIQKWNSNGTHSFYNKVFFNGDIDALSNLKISGVSTFVGNAQFEGNLEIKSVTPELIFNDTTGTPDYKIRKQSGNLMIMETTQTNDSQWRLSIRNGGTVDIPGGINVGGISTFSDDIIVGVGATVGFGTTAYFRDNARAVFGDDEDLSIYHDGEQSILSEQGTGGFRILTSTFRVRNPGDNSTFMAAAGNYVVLNHGGDQRLKTTEEGVLVSGGTTTGTLNVTGISTFGDVVGFSSDVNIGGLSTSTDRVNVNVTGIVTVTKDIYLGEPVGISENKIYNRNNTGSNFGFLSNGRFSVMVGASSQFLVTSSGVIVYQNLEVGGRSDLDKVNIDETLNVVGFSTFRNTVSIAATESTDAILELIADEGDDNADKWRIRSTTGNDLKFESYASGAWSDGVPLKLGRPGSGDADGIVTIPGQARIGGGSGGGGVLIYDNIVRSLFLNTNLKIEASGTGIIHMNDNVGINSASATHELEVLGDTSLKGNLNVTGITSFTDTTNSSSETTGAVIIAGGVGISKRVNLKSDATINGILYVQGTGSQVFIDPGSQIDCRGNLSVDGRTELDITNISETLNVTGISTFAGQVGFGTHITLEDYGRIQLGEKSGGDFFIGHNPTLYGGVYNELVSTNGNILLENRDTGANKYLYLKADQVNIRSYTGNEAFITCSLNSNVKLWYDNSERFATTTYGALLTGGTSGIGTLAGPATFHIDPVTVGNNTGTVVIKGNLQVDGTTTTINSTTVSVDDKNLELGSGAANDAAADGGGITIVSGEGNKTFQFEATGDNLGSSEHINIATGKVYKVNNVETLSATTLGSAVVNSSLTNLGTLTSLTVSGAIDANGNLDVAGISTLGSGASGSVDLQHQGSTKLDTKSWGIDVSGVIQGETAIQCHTNATGALAKTTHGLIHGASKQAIFQFNSVDDKIYLINNTSDKEFALLANDSGDVGWKVIPDGAVELYHNDVKRLTTTNTGVDITDNLKVVGISTFSGDVHIGGATITNPAGNAVDFNGSITASDIITAGALLHEGDTDTLVHFSAANTIELKTGGFSRFAVNNSGVALQNNTTFNVNGGRIILGDSTGGTTDDRIVLGNSDDCFLYHDSTDTFIENNTGILKILGNTIQLGDGTDKVGINSTSPTHELEVLGDSSLKGNLTVSSISTQSTHTNKALQVRNNSDTNTFAVSYRGQGYFATGIGIGTDNPAAPFHISGADANAARMLIEDNNNGFAASELRVQNGGRDLRIAAPVDIFFQRFNINTPVLYLENGNAVGIKTDNPGATLDVFGNTKLRGDVDIDGQVGIGTDAPSAKLEAYGTDASIIVHNPGESRGGIAGFENQRLALVSTHVNDDLVFGYTNNPPSGANFVERMRIDNGTGNVGIGTTLPKQQLEVFSGSAGRPTFRHTGGYGGLQIAGPQAASGAALMFTRSYDVVGGGLTAYSIQMAGNTQGLHFVSGDPSEASTKTRLFLNSAGSVGINTSNPRQKLHLDNGYMFVRGDTAPQVRMNAAINDTSSTRFTFGLATGANNFFNGAQSLDGCVAAPSTGRLVLGVGVAARMYIVNSGDVTIGRPTQLGNAKLSVQCDSGSEEGIAVNLNQNSGISTAFAIWNNTGSEVFNLAQDTDSTPDLIFKIKNTGESAPVEKVRFTSDGKVLIGTTTEGHANADDLTIATSGDTGITIRSGTTHNGRIYFSDATSGAGEVVGSLDYDHNDNKFSIHTNGGERLRIDSSGRLLLGTDTEGHPNADDLTIATDGDTGITIRSGTTNNGRIYFSDATSGAGEVVGSLDYDHNNDSFSIFTGGGLRFRINGDGNVDINNGLTVSGISTFSGNVDINADLDVDGHTELDNLNVAGVSTFTGQIFTGKVKISSDVNALSAPSVAGNYHLHITNPQNDAGETVGIAFGLSTGGDIGAAITHERQGSMSLGNLRFYTKENTSPASMLERMRITNDGKVGIGSTSPTHKLEVLGDFSLKSTDASVKSSIRSESFSGSNHSYLHGFDGTLPSGLTIRSNESILELIAQAGGTHGGSFLIRDSSNDGFGFVNDPTNEELQLKSFTTSADNFRINSTGANVSRLDDCIVIKKDGSVKIFNDGNKRLETTDTGVDITDNLNVAGITTSIGVINSQTDIRINNVSVIETALNDAVAMAIALG